MDGNGRWARNRGLPRWRGHLAGVKSVRAAVEAAPGMGIDTLTLYAFSSDNWKRPAGEVRRLFGLLEEYCARERNRLLSNGVRLTAIGRRDRLPAGARRALEDTEAATRDGRDLHLRLAIDYSSRGAITTAAQRLAGRVASGTLAPADITADALDRELTGGAAPPDLLIRTAGERRLSDFLLWEAAYAELHFAAALWPDFREDHLWEALEDYRRRERRFGGLDAPHRLDQPVTTAPDRLAG